MQEENLAPEDRDPHLWGLASDFRPDAAMGAPRAAGPENRMGIDGQPVPLEALLPAPWNDPEYVQRHTTQGDGFFFMHRTQPPGPVEENSHHLPGHPWAYLSPAAGSGSGSAGAARNPAGDARWLQGMGLHAYGDDGGNRATRLTPEMTTPLSRKPPL